MATMYLSVSETLFTGGSSTINFKITDILSSNLLLDVYNDGTGPWQFNASGNVSLNVYNGSTVDPLYTTCDGPGSYYD